MDQVTAFNPPLHVLLLDGRMVKFARSTMDHWIAIAETMAAERRDALIADINAEAGLKPVERINAREQARDAIVSYDRAIDRCRTDPKWIKRHLTMALQEAGETDADAILAMIPPVTMAGIADQIAMLPVVSGARVGTDKNPLLAGVSFGAGDSTGGKSSDSSPGDIPASPPADAPTDSSTN